MVNGYCDRCRAGKRLHIVKERFTCYECGFDCGPAPRFDVKVDALDWVLPKEPETQRTIKVPEKEETRYNAMCLCAVCQDKRFSGKAFIPSLADKMRYPAHENP